MATPESKDIENLVELFNRSDWEEMHLKTDGLEIFMSNDPNASGPTKAIAVPATVVEAPRSATAQATPSPTKSTSAGSSAPAPVTVPEGMVGVSAPNLGTFYRAPKPGAPAYVEVGQTVEADTEVCLIEVMKLFTPVSAGTAGVVREVCIDDGQMVEFGQVLVIIEPNA